VNFIGGDRPLTGRLQLDACRYLAPTRGNHAAGDAVEYTVKVVACRRPLCGRGYVQFHRDSDAQTVAHDVQQFTMRKEFGDGHFTGSIIDLKVIVIEKLFKRSNSALNVRQISINMSRADRIDFALMQFSTRHCEAFLVFSFIF